MNKQDSESTASPGTRPNLLSVLSHDVPSSIVVFLVALPLSLGIALASGAPLMAGVIAAVVGGIVVGLLGGAPLQVSGPAAGLTVLVFGYIQQFGWRAMCALAVGAGIVQIILGAARVAPLALGISPAVIHGMLAGIGVLIALSQAHVVLGGKPHGEGVKNLLSLPEAVAHVKPEAAFLGLLTVALLVIWPRLPWKRVKALPGALVAVVITTVVAVVFRVDAAKVSLGGSLLHSIQLPALPQGNLVAAIAAVLTLAFVASAESLLSAVATDKLHSGPRANLHRELMAQGAANTVSGLLGGLPVTGVIVRSTANITSGARTRLSAVLHGVWVLLFVMLLPGLITQVPLAALAGLLVYTGIRLVNLKHLKELRHHGEEVVYAATLLGVVATNLLEGLAIGFGVAVLRLIWRLTHVDIHVFHEDGRWRVYIDGALSFAGVPKLLTRLEKIPAASEVEFDIHVRHLDHAGYEALTSWREGYERMGGVVHMVGLDDSPATRAGKEPPGAERAKARTRARKMESSQSRESVTGGV